MAKQANKHLTLRQIDFYTPKSDKNGTKEKDFSLFVKSVPRGHWSERRIRTFH